MKNAISLFVEALILGLVALLLFRLSGLVVACLIVLFTLLIVIFHRKIGLW